LALHERRTPRSPWIEGLARQVQRSGVMKKALMMLVLTVAGSWLLVHFV
jgi:hypothetical protein